MSNFHFTTSNEFKMRIPVKKNLCRIIPPKNHVILQLLKGYSKKAHILMYVVVLCCQAYAVDPIIFLWARALMQEICDVMYTTPLTSNISS